MLVLVDVGVVALHFFAQVERLCPAESAGFCGHQAVARLLAVQHVNELLTREREMSAVNHKQHRACAARPRACALGVCIEGVSWFLKIQSRLQITETR